MSHRQITESDTAAEAERKAAAAETVRCQIIQEHFLRVIALLDHAEQRGHTRDVPPLLPLAFAPSAMPPDQARTLTARQAQQRAQSIVDELGLAELTLREGVDAPDTAHGDTLLRKSRAVVDEDRTLDRIHTLVVEMRIFNDALSEHHWAAAFRRHHPSPT